MGLTRDVERHNLRGRRPHCELQGVASSDVPLRSVYRVEEMKGRGRPAWLDRGRHLLCHTRPRGCGSDPCIASSPRRQNPRWRAHPVILKEKNRLRMAMMATYRRHGFGADYRGPSRMHRALVMLWVAVRIWKCFVLLLYALRGFCPIYNRANGRRRWGRRWIRIQHKHR